MNKIKILTITMFSVFALLAPAFYAGIANAASTNENATQGGLCAGSELQPPSDAKNGSANCTNINQSSSSSVEKVVTLVINIFSWVVGVVAVIMIIYGGFQYITAAGDSTKVGNAKNTILYALIGLVIVALAQVIVRFVLGNVTNIAN